MVSDARLRREPRSAPQPELEPGWHPLRSPEDWWRIVLGTGLRATVEQLTPDARERVRQANLTWAREQQLTAVQTNVLYALA